MTNIKPEHYEKTFYNKMAVLPLGVLFLSAFINNTLFIQVDPKISQNMGYGNN